MPENRRVLVVDDDEGTVLLLSKVLRAGQWEVDACHSGREASAKIRPGQYQLVVSDLYMPDGNGVELYESAVQADPDLRKKFIFVSGYADSSAVNSFLLETGCPGIRKPIRIDEFREIVAHVGEDKPLHAKTLPSRWFTPDSQYLYSGEVTGRHTLFSLLNQIYAARLIGELQLLMGRVEKRLYFNLGTLVFASSNLPADGLGEVMLREGALTQSQFEEATRRMEEGQRFGFALVDLGVCDLTTIAEWVRKQVTRIATSVFDCTAGRYYFHDSFAEHIVPEVGIAVPLGRLMLPALRSATDLPLSDLANDEGLQVDLTPDPLLRFQDVELNASERAVLAAAIRPMKASELLRTCGIPTADAARALYGLLALGMLMAIPSEEAPAPEKPKPAPPAARKERNEELEGTRIAFAREVATATRPPEPEHSDFEAEMQKLLEVCDTGTYYQLLGASANTPGQQIRANYYKLARKFHPDRHMGRADWIDPLQKLMHSLNTAYRTLTDEKAKKEYDDRLAKAGTFTLGVSKSEQQQSADECLEEAKRCLRARNYAGSIPWLRKCVEIAPNESKYRAILARSLAAVPQYRREAVEHFEAAIRLDPWNTSAYLQFAELYEEMELPWRARPLYEKILDIDPEHSKARERLRQINAKEGKKDEKSPTFIGRILGRKG